jgi:hypothetical protein
LKNLIVENAKRQIEIVQAGSGGWDENVMVDAGASDERRSKLRKIEAARVS